MSNAFMTALAAQAQKVQADRESKPKRKEPAMPSIPPFTIDIVVDRNRLDVKFDDIPPKYILQSFKDWGFRFNPTEKTWYHKDTEENREVLRNMLNVAIGPKELEKASEPECPRCNLALASCICNQFSDAETLEEKPVEETPENFSPEFSRYRQQVNELLEHLKCEPADLMLIAINCLHKVTFTQN